MRIDQSRLRRPGVAIAAAALIVAGVIGGVGVAGAQEEITIYSVNNPALKPCFTETAGKTVCDADEQPTVTIRTGDTVKFDMSSGGVHNASPKSSTPADAAWDGRSTNTFPPTDQWTFGKAGTYEFLCTAHAPYMSGTIIVEGGTVETPTPTATPTSTPVETPTFSATVPPSATPVADNHTTTPAPGKGKAAKDTDAPRLLRAQVKSAPGGAKLNFWVSEPANVDVTVRRGKSVVTSARLHVAAGTRSLVVRSSSLRKRGSYSVEWVAVDAMGNKGNVVKKTLKVKG